MILYTQRACFGDTIHIIWKFFHDFCFLSKSRFAGEGDRCSLYAELDSCKNKLRTDFCTQNLPTIFNSHNWATEGYYFSLHMLPWLCLQTIMVFTTAAWLLPHLEDEYGTQRDWRALRFDAEQEGRREKQVWCPKLTWLLHRTAGVLKLALSLSEPGGWFCFGGGFSNTASKSVFSDKLQFSSQCLVKKKKKKEFFKNKPFQCCQALLTYNPSSSPCTAWELHARMKAVASLKLGLADQRASEAAQHLQAQHLYLSSTAEVWLRPLRAIESLS